MSIRFKLIFIFLLLVSAPLVLVGLLTFKNYEQSLETSRLAQLQDLARFKADRIESYFVQIKDGMSLAQTFYNIRKNLPVLASVPAGSNNPANAEAKKILDIQMVQTRKVLGLSDIMLAKTDGTIVYVTNPEHYADEISKKLDVFWPASSTMNVDSFCLSGIFIDTTPTIDRPEMLAMAPVTNLAGKRAGTVVFEIDMGPLYALIQDTIGLGKTGEVLVCEQAGQDVLFLNPLRHDSTAALKRRVRVGTSTALPAQQALSGIPGAGRSIDYRGQPVVAAWRSIPSLKWGLVAKIDSHEAFQAVTKLRRLLLIILFVVLVLAVIITLFVTLSISRPIQVLSHGAKIIGSGNLNHKVGTTSPDEIGQLSRAFDQMTNDLKTTMASRDDLNREIVERTHAQQDLARSNKDLEQFAYVASHDLQEPLRAVAGFMGLLNRQYRAQLDAEAQEYIDLSVEGAERMQTLIHDLLAFSRVGTKGGEFERIALDTALENALRALHASIVESQARVTRDELPVVNADLSQMTQLFQNLIGNAIKFHGTVSSLVHISAIRQEQFWRISVRDNGIGIEPHYFSRIFLIFQRLHTRSEYSGTGIGLAICKKIVERHGGRLWVESEPGHGSVFYFTIPAKEIFT